MSFSKAYLRVFEYDFVPFAFLRHLSGWTVSCTSDGSAGAQGQLVPKRYMLSHDPSSASSVEVPQDFASNVQRKPVVALMCSTGDLPRFAGDTSSITVTSFTDCFRQPSIDVSVLYYETNVIRNQRFVLRNQRFVLGNQFYLNKDWECVILREIDFLLKICWSIPCLHPSWNVHTWIEICASLNHRKKTKADGSRLIPRKHTETLVLLGVTNVS